jgi:hypothetical protein
MRCFVYVAHMELRSGTRGVLVGNILGSLLGRPRHKRRYTAEVDIKEIEWQSVGGIYVAQDRGQWRAVLNTVINLGVP